MSEKFVRRHGIATREKARIIELAAADGSDLPTVTRETAPVTLTIGQHREEIQFNVLSLAEHDVIIGFPWLSERNPVVDWKKRVLTIRNPAHGKQAGSVRPAARPRNEERRIYVMNLQPTSDSEEITAPTETARGTAAQQVRSGSTNQAPDIPQEYKEWIRLFEEEGDDTPLPKHEEWDHEIKIEPGSKIPYQRPRPKSKEDSDAEKEWLDKLLKRGWIRPSKSSAATPCMQVPKKNGKKRTVQDYRRLNEVTIKDRYPLPNIGEIRDRLQGANWFTKIDLRDAFYSIRMKKGEEWKTAIITQWGLYEFLVMPMGLTNAPATQQRCINHLLRDLLEVCVVAYVDDILIYTKGSLQQHQNDVKKVLSRLAKSSFRTAPEKCEFHKKEVEFLGFIIGHNKIQMSPEKVKAILEWPTPENVTGVQSFLGLANYLRTHVPGYSKKAIPLTNLTKKSEPFNWTSDQEKAFQQIKNAIADDIMLTMFDPELSTQIETDASDLAIGACLTQTKDGKRIPIAFYSRKMTPAEQNYDIHDKELLAVVSSLMHWRIYAEGAKDLTIYTDHKNLLTFTTTKVLNRRQVRWAETLSQFKFKIQYTPGKDNVRADALSRRSDYMKDKEVFDHSILKRNPDGTLSANAMEINAISQVLEDPDEEFPTETKIRVESSQEQDIIKGHHDGRLYGHPGIEKTLELIRRTYVFPKMKEKVTQYIAKCEECQRNKAERHATQGEIQPIAPPTEPWEEVTMDFITDLPESRDPVTEARFNGIMVVVDRLTKYAHFLPYRKDYDAPKVANLVLDRVIRLHGLPKRFITDRDKLFTSNFWKTITAKTGIKHVMSTAFHPQTDGQTERLNQNIETYLRHYVDYRQTNWCQLLPVAQLALNNVKSSTTGISPFFANHGRWPYLHRESLPGMNADAGIYWTLVMQETFRECQRRILDINDKMRRYSKNIPGPQLKRGDKTYVRAKNFATKRASKKLDSKYVGPFMVEEQVSPVNYRIALPMDTRKHQVFHVSQLKKADATTPLQKRIHHETLEEDEFEVERILKHQGSGKSIRYLIKWKGYPNSENTWEPLDNLNNCGRKMIEYHATLTRQPMKTTNPGMDQQANPHWLIKEPPKRGDHQEGRRKFRVENPDPKNKNPL